MLRSRTIPLIAVASFAVLLAAVAFNMLTQPTLLRIAVGQASSDNIRLVAAISQVFAREHAAIRLKLVSVPNSNEAAAALDKGIADLAVSRADIAIPRRGETVAILHRDPVVILATARSGVTKPVDLAGHAIGLPAGLGANQTVLRQLLAYYEIPEKSVRVEIVEPDDIADAVREGRIDVALLVRPIGSKALRDAYDAIAREGGGPPALVGVPEAKAIAQRNPAVEDEEIFQGAFVGNPPVPAEAIHTISITHRIFASRDLSESTVSEFTRLLFVLKPTVAAEVPIAGRIEAESTENNPLPVHAGAVAYYDGEVPTFMERWGDWIYIGAMVFGFGGSAVAALFGRDSHRSRQQANALLAELLTLLNRARTAESRTMLDDLEHQADVIFAATVMRAADHRLDSGAVATFSFAFDQVRRAIEDRRKLL